MSIDLDHETLAAMFAGRDRIILAALSHMDDDIATLAPALADAVEGITPPAARRAALTAAVAELAGLVSAVLTAVQPDQRARVRGNLLEIATASVTGQHPIVEQDDPPAPEAPAGVVDADGAVHLVSVVTGHDRWTPCGLRIGADAAVEQATTCDRCREITAETYHDEEDV